MKTVEMLIDRIMDSAAQLAAEYRVRLAEVPEPATDVADLLIALASAEEHIKRHFAFEWGGDGHEHTGCQKNGQGLCAKCEDWRDCCREKDAAVNALVSYALALRAKREAA